MDDETKDYTFGDVVKATTERDFEWATSIAQACGPDTVYDPICDKPGRVQNQIKHLRDSVRFRERLVCINKICPFCAAGLVLEPNMMFHRDPEHLVASGSEVYSCNAALLWGSLIAIANFPEKTQLDKHLRLLAAKVKDPEKVWTFQEDMDFLNNSIK